MEGLEKTDHASGSFVAGGHGKVGAADLPHQLGVDPVVWLQRAVKGVVRLFVRKDKKRSEVHVPWDC